MEDNVHSRKVCRFRIAEVAAPWRAVSVSRSLSCPVPQSLQLSELARWASARSARVSGFLRCSLRGGEGLGRLLSFAFESFDIEGPPPPGRD
jgi:hypothetical protein